MRVFVTGATGFVGQAAVRTLLARGHAVLALARGLPHDMAAARTLVPGASFVQGSLAEPEALAGPLAAFAPDALLHLAWEGLPDYSEAVCQRNVDLGLNAFALARVAGARSIVAAGSCWEYAARQGQLAEAAPLRTDQPFPAAKNRLRAEGQALALAHGLHFAWLRIFFVYGPGQRPASLVPSLITQALRGQAPALRCPANANDFIHVDDVALALALALEKRPAGLVYNAGSGTQTRVADVARMVYSALGREALLDGPAGLDEAVAATPATEEFCADMTRTQADLGFAARLGLAEGVAAMLRQAQAEGEGR